MELSSIILVILFVSLIALLITYSVITTVRPSSTALLTPKSGPINTPTNVGGPTDARDLFLAPAGGTLMTYLFCAVNSKTPSIGSKQEPIPILRIGSVMRLELLPGGVSMAPKTRLMVQTQGPTIREEELQIADFPQQTWVHLAIVREGRRFTVYYNGKVASSQRTTYVPAINSARFTIGNQNLQGQFVYPKLAGIPYRMEDIQQELAQTSDTRHKPYTSGDVMDGFQRLFQGCPNGVFCFSTSGKPAANPLQMWQTPYA
jgi:hypothetical protein